MAEHGKIDYVELPASDFPATRAFFSTVFGWQLEEYGPDYMAFVDQGVDGGFFRSEQSAVQDAGSVLVIFYSSDLEDTQTRVASAGGTISRDTYHFPGGRRFHFLDPNGNEWAVWTDLEPDGSRVG